MEVIKISLLLFLCYQCFKEEKIYLKKLQNPFYTFNSNSNWIDMDISDISDGDVLDLFQNAQNNIRHMLKENREEIVKFKSQDHVAFAYVEHDQQVLAILLAAIGGIMEKHIFIDNISVFENLFIDFKTVNQLKVIIRDIFSEITPGLMQTRFEFRNAIDKTNNFDTLRHVKMHGNLDKNVDVFLDVFREVGILRNFKFMNVKKIIQKTETMVSQSLKNSGHQLSDSIVSLPDILSEANSDYKDKIENYLNEASKVIQTYMEITEIVLKLNAQIDALWFVINTFLVLELVFAFYYFHIIKSLKHTYRSIIEKEKINKGSEMQKMDKKQRKKEKRYKKSNTTTVYCNRNNEYSTIIDWVDLIPTFNMLSMNKYSSKVEETQNVLVHDFTSNTKELVNSDREDKVEETQNVLVHDFTSNTKERVNSDREDKVEETQNVLVNDFTPNTKELVNSDREDKVEETQNVLVNDFTSNTKDLVKSDKVEETQNDTQEMAIDFKSLCWNCDETEVYLLKCKGCKKARYCNKDCIREDWLVHGSYCQKVQDRRLRKKLKST